MRTRRRLFSAGGAAVLLGALAVTGITAFACTGTASLSLERGGVVTQGDTVTGTGANFSHNPGDSLVSIYFNALTGTPIATAAVTAAGTISYSFQVPSSTPPGYYFISASQTDSSAKLTTMNHPRTPLTVNAATATVQPPAPPNPPVVPQPGQAAPVQPPANVNPAPIQKPAPATKPVTAVGTQAQQPVAAQPAPAVVPSQAPAVQPAAVAPAPADAIVAPAPALAQPQLQPAAGSPSSAHSSSHPAAVLAMALVLGVLVLAVAVAAFVAAGRRGAGAEAKARR